MLRRHPSGDVKGEVWCSAERTQLETHSRETGSFTQMLHVKRKGPRTEPQVCTPFRGWRDEEGLHKDRASTTREVREPRGALHRKKVKKAF